MLTLISLFQKGLIKASVGQQHCNIAGLDLAKQEARAGKIMAWLDLVLVHLCAITFQSLPGVANDKPMSSCMRA